LALSNQINPTLRVGIFRHSIFLNHLFSAAGRLIPAACAPLMASLTLSSRVVSGGRQALHNFLFVSAQFFPCLHDPFITARAASAYFHLATHLSQQNLFVCICLFTWIS
jgi:hypothetical protein